MTMFCTIHVKEKWVKPANVLAYSIIIKILIIKEKMTLMIDEYPD